MRFTLVVLQPCPNGERPEGEAKTHLRDYVYISYSQRMPHDPQGGAGKQCWGERDVWIAMFSLPTSQPDPDNRGKNGWMDGG